MCVATLVLVSSGDVDTGQWSVADDVIDGGGQFVPVFQPTPRNVSADLGGRAVLRCRVENLGTRTVCHLSPFTFDPHIIPVATLTLT